MDNSMPQDADPEAASHDREECVDFQERMQPEVFNTLESSFSMAGKPVSGRSLSPDAKQEVDPACCPAVLRVVRNLHTFQSGRLHKLVCRRWRASHF